MSQSPAIVCIGGSAGSLPPLVTILASLPEHVHVPVVVVVHRGRPVGRPDESRLRQLIEGATPRRVREIEDSDELLPDTVFVAPPGYQTLVSTHSLVLAAEDSRHQSVPAIDALFQSAADAFGAGCVAVGLSCANTDGAKGAAAVAASGGTVIIQDAASIEHPQLIDRIVADGTPHKSLTPPQIAAELSHRFGG